MFKPKRTALAVFAHTLWPTTKRVFVVSVLSLLLLPLFFLTRGGTGVPRAYAATSDNLNFQARLETAAGAIAPDGYYNVQFKLYDASTSGTLLWTETYYDSNGGTAGNDNRVRVANGYVTVNLGSQTAFPGNMPWDQQLYLTMNVGGTTQTATPTWDGEMSPRLKLTAVPYAFNAKTASQIVSSSGANLATLSIAAPTSGNQTFTIQDQGAAGSYNILTQNQIQAGFIQNQNAAAQTTANFWISGNGRSDTAFQAPLFDTATAAALGIGTTNASSITIGATTVTTTVQGPFVANGSQFTNNGSTLLTGNTLSDFAASGAVGTAAATVDIYTTFVIPQTTAGRTLSLPAPTTGTAGRLAYVLNTGSSAFTMHGVSIQSGKAQTYIYDGSAWTATNIDGAGSGATFVGTIDSQTKSGDGAVLSGNGIYLQTADGSNPGLVSTGIQTFAGDKTFSGNVTINTGLTVSGANIDLNASSNFNTNINTGTSTGAVNIGNGAAGNISIQSGGTIGLTGTTTVLGTTTINGSGSAATTISTGTGNTTIGNTTGTTSITGSTNTVAGTTNINTTGTSTTTIGSATAGAVSITSNAASSFTTNTGALTLTSAAAATWGTNAGALTLQGAGGTTVTSTAGATSGDTTISTGNASAGASGNIAIDTGTATTTAGTVSIGTTNASGVTIGRAATTTTIQGTLSITPQASSSTTLLCTNVGVLSTCDASVIAPTATNFIQNQNAIQQTTANFWISGTGRADTSILTPTLDTATAVALNIGTTNATSINLNQDTVLAAGQTISITGDTRANITAIGSPTEGMTTYDTTNKQLLTYSNGKWQADRRDAVLVAAADSSQVDKDAADYVADGNTAAAGDGDQVQINSALTAGAGKKVVLLAGTYTVDDSVYVPNNTVLTGIGPTTVITVPNGLNGSIPIITNADIYTGKNITIRDLKIDGNKANQTGGAMYGIVIAADDFGAYIPGVVVTNTIVTNVYNGYGIQTYRAQNAKLSGNTASNNGSTGIIALDSPGAIITGNVVSGNSFSGIHLHTSAGSTVSANVASGNSWAGIAENSSDGITVTGNTASANTGGISMYDTTNSTITGNAVVANVFSGIDLTSANKNTIASNTFSNNGDTTDNNGIYLYSNSDSNTVTNNTITDTSCTTTCYAINIYSNSDTNYLANNTFTGDGTYAATINDAGTNTIYAGQSMTQGGLDIRFKQANSTTAFNIQNANGVSVMNVDTTNGELEVGTYNGGTNPVAGKIVIATTANANTVTIASATQTTGSFTLSIPDLTANADVCTSLNNCGSLTSTSGIQNQNASAQTANFWISGTGRADTSILTPTLDTATATTLNIGTTNATSINLNQDTTVASGKNLTVTSGTTSLTGTTNINTSGSATTTIGNASATNAIAGTTSVLGTTDINTTGTAATSIGSATGGAVSIAANAASSFTTNTGALTLTSAAAATWGTNAGALTLQGAGGTTVTSTAGATSGDTTISTGNASAGASGNIAIDTGTATTTAGTVSIGTTNASGVTIGRAATTTTIQGTLSITPQASSSTTLLCTNGGVLSTCDASVIAPTATNFIQNQNAIQQTTANFWISGTGRADTSILTPTLDTATAVALSIGTTNATSINLNQDTVLAAGQSITITGGNTASRPAGVDGMVYYDTDTKQLLTYANGKWQADRSEAVLVAASDSSDADKAAADYIADGDTVAAGDGDQVQINNALTAASASGARKTGKVYLFAGTYTADATILIPNGVTLAGSGQSSIIKLADIDATDNLIENSDTTTGTNITIRDLRLEGQRNLNTAGTQIGIYLLGMGKETSGNDAVNGAFISNVTVYYFRTDGIRIDGSSHNTVTSSIFRDNAQYGLYILGVASKFNSITANHSEGNNVDGFRLEQGYSNTFSGNIAYDNASAGMAIASSANSNNIVNNNFRGNNTYGIYMGASSLNNVSSNNIRGGSTYGIYISGSDGSTINDNNIYDTGSTTANNAIYLTDSDRNSINGNVVDDTSASTNNYAINISNSTSNSNYIAGNILGDNGSGVTATINDAATDTVYGGQATGLDSTNIIFKQAASATAFQIQSGSTNYFTADTSGNKIQIGSATTDATAILFGLDSYNNGTDPTGYNGAMYYNTNTNKFRCYENGAWANCTASAANVIQNQNASAQTTANFWISGTGRADTAILTPLVDTATAIALNIGTTNATQINLNKNVSIAANQNITFAAGTGNFDQSASSGTFKTGTGAVSLNGDTTVTTGKNFTVTNGTTSITGTTNINVANNAVTNINTGASAGAVNIGSSTSGAVTIAANAASSFSTSTGNLSLDSAAQLQLGTGNATSLLLGKTTTTATVQGSLTVGGSAGTGVFTNNGATINTEKAYGNFASGGALDTAANSVDKYTYFSVAQTTASQTITLPTPTTSPTTIFGRIIHVSNIGSTSFTIGGSLILPGFTATFVWSNTDGAATGGETWQYAGDGGGSGSYIQNQTASAQTAGFNINGAGTLGGLLTANAGLTVTGAAINLNTASNFAVNIASTSNTAAVTIGNSANVTNIGSNTIYFGTNNGTIVLTAAAQTGATAGNSVTIKAGAGGTGNQNGGTLALSGGDASGTGVKGLVTLNPTAFTGTSQNCSAASCSITAATVNANSTALVNNTYAGSTVTLADPTITTAGRVLYVTNSGTQDMTLSVNGGGTGNTIALKPNTTATMFWNGVDWTAAGASSATDLQAAYNNTQSTAGGAEIVLKSTLDTPAGTGGMTIRNNSGLPISGGLLEVQTSIGTNLFSVNSYGTELASNGGAETAGGSATTFPASTWSAQSTATVSRTITSGEYQTGEAGVKVVTTGVNQGVRNQLTGNPAASTTYTVSFTAASTTAGQFTTPIEVIYSPDNGTTLTNICQGYGLEGTTLRTTFRNISNATNFNWTKVTCTVTTTGAAVTTPLLIIRQTDATARTIYVDNLSFIRNDSTTRPANVQMGGGNTGGQVTLFTLDRSSTAPLVSNGDDRYIGSMYYDTTLGNIQCYEADGWGACGSAPDNIITYTPEYTGAVLNGTGVGTMTADFCGNGGGLSVNTGFCASGEARNYYRWTSPQATDQTYSIYVSYRLPSTFKEFESGTTSLTSLVDNTSNASVKYAIFKKTSTGGLTSCSADATMSGTVNTWNSTTPTTDLGTGACHTGGATPFAAGDTMVIRITVSAKSNASAYVENLTFRYSNK